MKFGSVPVAEAVGAMLAHSVKTPSGRLRKGLVLTSENIGTLSESGIAEVVVARMESDDVAENDAAQLLARAVGSENAGLRHSAAFTGRVNLLAQEAGVAVLDAQALHAVNEVHPMITIATVPAFQQMAKGGMIATIKIISYAVPQIALAQACSLGRDAVRLAEPQIGQATLIITDIPGGAGDKGRDAIAQRLVALGVTLRDVVRVPHEAASLAAAISESDSPLLLILTGSATSDENDVGPAALRAAGGQVLRFGMPVDPGNLLFLGTIAERTVIGLPGCARSPALNGADWVLSRVICGIPVGSADIAAMGVGGLLKEIPTRPQPREPRTGRK